MLPKNLSLIFVPTKRFFYSLRFIFFRKKKKNRKKMSDRPIQIIESAETSKFVFSVVDLGWVQVLIWCYKTFLKKVNV